MSNADKEGGGDNGGDKKNQIIEGIQKVFQEGDRTYSLTQLEQAPVSEQSKIEAPKKKTETKLPKPQKVVKYVMETPLFLQSFDLFKIPAKFDLAQKHAKSLWVGPPKKPLENNEICKFTGRYIERQEINFLTCDPQSLDFLGAAYPLFFDYIQFSSIILIMLFLTSGGYNFLSNLMMGSDCLTEDQIQQLIKQFPKTDKNSICHLNWATQGSLANKRTDSKLMGLQEGINILSIITLVAVFQLFRQSQREIASLCVRPQQCQDFTILVKKIPIIDDMMQLRDKLKAFFKEQTGNEPVMVANVFNIQDMDTAIANKKKQIQLYQKEIEWSINHNFQIRDADRIVQIHDQIAKNTEQYEKLTKSYSQFNDAQLLQNTYLGICFVTFDTMDEVKAILQSVENQQKFVMDGHELEICEADHPEQIYYSNLRFGKGSVLLKQLGSLLFDFVIQGLCVAIQQGIKMFNEWYSQTVGKGYDQSGDGEDSGSGNEDGGGQFLLKKRQKQTVGSTNTSIPLFSQFLPQLATMASYAAIASIPKNDSYYSLKIHHQMINSSLHYQSSQFFLGNIAEPISQFTNISEPTDSFLSSTISTSTTSTPLKSSTSANHNSIPVPIPSSTKTSSSTLPIQSSTIPLSSTPIASIPSMPSLPNFVDKLKGYLAEFKKYLDWRVWLGMFVGFCMAYIIQALNDGILVIKSFAQSLLGHYNKTDLDIAKAQKMSIMIFINTSLINLGANVLQVRQSEGPQKAQEAIFKPNGLIQSQHSVALVLAIVNNLKYFIDLGKWRQRVNLEKMKLQKDKCVLTQGQLNAMYEDQQFDIGIRYATITSIMYSAVFYAPLLPIVLVYNAVNLILLYYIEKQVLLNDRVVQGRGNPRMSEDMIDMLSLSLPIYCVIELKLSQLINPKFQVSNALFEFLMKQNGGAQFEMSTLSMIGIGLGLLHVFLPLGKLNEQIFDVPEPPEGKQQFSQLQDTLGTDFRRSNPAYSQIQKKKFAQKFQKQN